LKPLPLPPGFRRKRTKADGNCLFRSFSQSLYDSPKHHDELRCKVVEHMSTNKSQFEDFFVAGGDDNYLEFEDYLDEMNMDTTWGDHLCLKAMADLFPECTIIIWNSEQQVWIKEIFGNGKHYIFFEFTGIHYNVLESLQNENIELVRQEILRNPDDEGGACEACKCTIL